MKRLLYAIVLSSFIATHAIADYADRYYLAADFGSASLHNMPGWTNPSVLRITGGYYFSPFMSLELGYSSFGDTTGPSGDAISASSFQFAAIATLPITTQFDLLGKLGIASNYYDYYPNNSPYPYANYSESQSDFLYGVGAQFHINSQVGLRVLYDNYGKFDNFNPPMKASSVSLGLMYVF
jgi:OOP family OmpA-OmpF porin